AQRVFIEFDGVMANSDVWINGVHLGKRPYGYVSFDYELTGHLQFGRDKTNFLAVRADNSQQPASRWYTGAGIYRHVRLIVTSPVHVETSGLFVSSTATNPQTATVRVQVSVTNASEAAQQVSINTIFAPPNGKSLNFSFVPSQEPGVKSIPAGQSAIFQK